VIDFLNRSTTHKLNPVLSLMCGHAEDELYLAQNGFDVYAIDNDPQKVKIIQQRISQTQINRLRVFNADILQPLPFDSRSFSSLYFKFGLHYFCKTQVQNIIIPEIIRLLNPGSFASIIFRKIDVQLTDRDLYDLTDGSDDKITFIQKGSKEIFTRYYWDEYNVKRALNNWFRIISTVTHQVEVYDRFSNRNKSTIIDLFLSLR